jgi:predicted flap endonuclease-1-like 5' DNA nuclease
MSMQETLTQEVKAVGREAGQVAQDVGHNAASLLDSALLVLMSPIIVPALLLGLRPVAKTVVKGSLSVTGAVTQLATVTSAGWSDLLAEARAEAPTAQAVPQTALVTPAPSPAETAAGRAEGESRLVTSVPGPAPREEPPELVDPQGHPVPPVDQPDLRSIPGIGSKNATLLQAVGVHTVQALTQSDPAALHAQLLQGNAQHQVLDRVPTLEQVTDWIAQARRVTA